MLIMKNGKRHITEGMEQPNQEKKNRQYQSRKEGKRELASIEDSIDA